MGAKSLRIRFDKIDGFRIYDGIRCLVIYDYKMQFMIGLDIL